MSIQRRRVVYFGRVQGVGFRYSANRIAQSFDLLGMVRNLEDGQVELVVEGPKSEVELFLGAVHEAMKEYIESVEVEELPLGAPALQSFCVVC